MIALVGCMLPACSVYAISIPDAGSIYRDEQIQRQQLQAPSPPVMEKRKENTTIVPGKGKRVKVTGFVFKGYEGLATQSELDAIVEESIGGSLDFADLQALTDRVTVYLKENGWLLARAYLAPMDVTDGVITIVIIQGKSEGKVNLITDKSVRISRDVLNDIAASATKKGEAINNDKLERAVMLMNDLPGVKAKTAFSSGTIYGTSGIDVSVREGPLASGFAWVDNYADYYSGVWRANTLLFINDPFNYGDQASLHLNYASGLNQARLGYSFPLASNGLRARFSGSTISYELGRELGNLRYKGSIYAVEAGVSYPVIRSRTNSLMTALTYGFRSLSDLQLNQEIQNKKLNTVTLSVSGDRYNPLSAGYTLNWNASFTTGMLNVSLLDFNRSPIDEKYMKVNAGAQNTVMLDDQFSLVLGVSVQKAFNNLDSSEKLALGGINAVRAYPIGEAAGDSGGIVNAEIQYRMPVGPGRSTLQLSGFFDAGYISLYTNDTGIALSTATKQDSYWLKGAGVGIVYGSPNEYTIRGAWANVIGENPGQSTSGNNVDGRNDQSRFWLQGLLYF